MDEWAELLSQHTLEVPTFVGSSCFLRIFRIKIRSCYKGGFVAGRPQSGFRGGLVEILWREIMAGELHVTSGIPVLLNFG